MPEPGTVSIPLSKGLIVDPSEADWLDALPVNLLAVPKDVLESPGYLRSWPGLSRLFTTSGISRGAVNNIPLNELFRIQGTDLINSSGAVLADVGGTGHAAMPFSGTTQGIVSANALNYWNGTTLTQLQNWEENEFFRTWSPLFANSYISLATPFTATGNANFEAEVKLVLTGAAANSVILEDSTEDGFQLYVTPSGQVGFQLDDTATAVETTAAPITNDTRHKIRVEFNDTANTITVFVDDAQIQQFAGQTDTFSQCDTIGDRSATNLNGQIFNVRLEDETTAANTRIYPLLLIQNDQPTVLTVDTSPIVEDRRGTLIGFPVGNEWAIGRFTDSAATNFDIGEVIDAVYENGRYHWISRGSGLVGVTDLTNEQRPDFVSPFFSAEAGFDDNLGISRWKKLIVVFGRFTTEFFRATGVAEPIYRPDRSLTVQAGIVGPGAKCDYLDNFAIVGGPENEPVSVYLIGQGQYTELATRRVQKLLRGYTDAELALTYIEPIKFDSHDMIIVHLLRDTLVYDHAASTNDYRRWTILESPVSGTVPYRGIYHINRNSVFTAGDKRDGSVSDFTFDDAAQIGAAPEYECFTPLVQAFRNMSLFDLQVDNIPGYNEQDYRLNFSVTFDGRSYGQEKWIDFSTENRRRLRVLSRRLGYVRNNIGFKLRWRTTTPSAISHLRVRPVQ